MTYQLNTMPKPLTKERPEKTKKGSEIHWTVCKKENCLKALHDGRPRVRAT